MKKAMKVSEDALLKALDTLEADVSKGEQRLPKGTKAANGGLTGEGGEGEEADVSVSGDEEDPSRKSTTASDEDADEEGIEKGDDEESSEESEDEESSEESSDDETPPAKGAKKSLAKSLAEDDTVSKAVEVSDFLEHLVDQTSGSVDGLAKSVQALSGHQTKFNGMVAKALTLIGNKLSSMQAQIEAFGDEAPVGPKSVLGKSLRKGDDGVQERFEQGTSFSKSDALDVLVDLVRKGEIHPAAVSQYETTNTLPAEIQKKVENELSRRG